MTHTKPDAHLHGLADLAQSASSDPFFMRNLLLSRLLGDARQWKPLAVALQHALRAHIEANEPAAACAGRAIGSLLDRLAAETISAQLHTDVLPALLQPQAS